MRFTTTTTSVLAVAAARVAAQDDVAATGELGDALIVEDNPLGAVWRGTFGPNPNITAETPAGGPVVGEVIATTPPTGTGVMFKISFQNLPAEGGPFGYHIHVDPVPENGDCTKTLAHLDPFIRGEDPACDPAAPETCQVGDLSGKHGKVDPQGGSTFEANYWDNYLALYEGPGAFFGNRSIVLHYANKTRLACANFVLASAGVGVDDEDCDGSLTEDESPDGTDEPEATETEEADAEETGDSDAVDGDAEDGGAEEADGEDTPVFDGAASVPQVSLTLLTTASLSVAALFSML